MTATSTIILEPAAQQVADAFSKPPFLYDMSPAGAREVLADAQSGPVSKFPVDEEWITVPSPVGDVRVRIIRPKGADGMLPVIVYMHGGGWILGNAQTHDRLVREADVLRDEGEAYAAKLRSAGVPVTTVRFDGTIHDFMLLNALSETRATRAAIGQATAFLRAGLRTA
jgi:acetyl esterase/lipase